MVLVVLVRQLVLVLVLAWRCRARWLPQLPPVRRRLRLVRPRLGLLFRRQCLRRRRLPLRPLLLRRLLLHLAVRQRLLHQPRRRPQQRRMMPLT